MRIARLVLLSALVFASGCCFTDVRRTRTIAPIREVVSRDPTHATVAIVVTSDESDPSLHVITVTRQVPVVRSVRRPTTTLWIPSRPGDWLILADGIPFWPIDSVASLVFFPVGLVSSDFRIHYGPLALVASVALPLCSVIPADVEEPGDWQFELAARKGEDTTFERLPDETGVEDEPLVDEPVIVECEGTRTELRTSRSGTVRFAKATYVQLAREAGRRSTSLTVSAAGAVVTLPIEEDDLVAAEDEVASSRAAPVAARRRVLLHERRIVAHATSLPGTWSEDQVVPHYPELHFRVRAEQSCEHFWKWRVQLRNDASEPLSLACSLADHEEVSYRDVDRFVVPGRGEVEAVSFLETQPKKDLWVVFGEMDR